MAADQRMKRSNCGNLVGCSSRKQRRAKKKKLGLIQDDLNIKSNISLNWDDKKKRVVAKREQIGISRRELAPFLDVVPHCHSKLADVFAVPQEIFELDNLVDVLSHEVWQSHLSENQRGMLMQFLPEGADSDYIVKELLSGDNFHFGNPFLKWGASVCSGKLHPDEVLLRERCIKANKDKYYAELQKYHNDMIENLQMWKERWNRCQDPEEEIVQKIWRSSKQSGKNIQLSETTCRDSEENQVGTPESSSWATSDRTFGIDNNPMLGVLAGEPQRRKRSDSKNKSSRDGLKVAANSKKVEKVHKRNIQRSDGAKYMAYIKVSREQHRRVKSTMKHTSNSIQPRSLNNVLGNLEALHVQPFEIFEEEERQKLHAYWLQLANRDIPACFANWTKRKLEMWQLKHSLCQEMEEKLKFQEQDEEKENSDVMPPEQPENRVVGVIPTNEGEEEDVVHSDSLVQNQMASQVPKDEIAMASEDKEGKKSDCIPQEQACDVSENIEDADQSASLSPEEHHLEKMVPISRDPQGNGMTVDSPKNDIMAKVDELPSMVPEYPRNLNHVDITVSQRDPREAADDVWSGVSVPGPYYNSTTISHGYVSSSEVSFSHQQVIEDQQVQMIHLEMDAQGKASGRNFVHREPSDLSFYDSYHNQGQSQLHEKDEEKDVLHRQPDDVSLFSSYTSQGRNELLDAFFKNQDGLTYHHQQKRMGLDFLHSDSLMMESGQFSGHFRDQVDISPLELRQRRVNDLYMGQNIQESVYSDEGRYSMSKDLPGNMQDWGTGTNRMLAPSQPNVNNGGLLSQNWFPVETRGRGAWPGLEGTVGPSRSIGSDSNSDQSLFGILAECNELRPGTAYDSMCSAERFMQSGAYSGLGGGIPGTSNILQQTPNPLSYLSRHEVGVGRRANNNLGWMALSHQSSGLQEPMSKPFVGSWNQ